MKERGIIMSGDNPKLILEGRKTQTRRIIRPSPYIENSNWHWPTRVCPYGISGGRLWVRETFAVDSKRFNTVVGFGKNATRGGELLAAQHNFIAYKSDGWTTKPPIDGGKWRPSIHMPRWASRITLEITKVRVERLQDISRDDAKAEGMELPSTELYPDVNTGDKLREQYRRLWDSLHGKGAWDKNPWVWVIEFDCLDGKTG